MLVVPWNEAGGVPESLPANSRWRPLEPGSRRPVVAPVRPEHALVALAWLCWTPLTSAQERPTLEPTEPRAESSSDLDSDLDGQNGSSDWDEEPLMLPPADDRRMGRFALSLGAGIVVPFGPLEAEIPWREASGLGFGGHLEPSVGVSRTVMLGLWGEADRLGDGNACADCSSVMLAGGPLVRFHLVQGLRFDPWVSIGVGLRSLRVQRDDDFDYVGLDWMRLTLGGDWYAVPNLAIAPYIQLTGGVTVERPDSPPVGDRPFDDGGAVYWAFSSGLRMTLSFPGH